MPSTQQTDHPTLAEATKTWCKIGLLSFGGPTAQIALMHNVTVDEKKWLTEEKFLSALSFCMLLPGPEAMQFATYVGWRLNGILGGLAAGLLFILPGACIVLALAMIYTTFGKQPVVEALFFGIKAAVLVIVINALLKIAKRALNLTEHWVIAALSFLCIFFLALPFPLLIFIAALWGYFRPNLTNAPLAEAPAPRPGTTLTKTLRTIALWTVLWLAPLAVIFASLGSDHVLTKLGIFFSKLAVVTFGGAYAVLAYMAQDVVVHHNWLEAGQMMDGLGLAETTPGPLILVTEFVGYLAAYQSNGGAAPWMGLAGALIALWATFTPCFLWIFAGAPYIEWITSQPKLKSALNAIIAAVVGVMLNLAIWFALHVFFEKVNHLTIGPINLWQPELASLDWRVLALAVISGILLLHFRWPIIWVLAASSALALALSAANI